MKRRIMPSDQDKVRSAHLAVANALGELADHTFTSDCKLSFVMRVPGLPDCFMVISDDDLDEVVKTIERSKTQAETSLAETTKDKA